MELRNKFAVFLLLSVCSVSCFPSRPLNDRPSELTWQAWLLVDSQNQLQNESDRRITPKSVFIAPKLGQRNDSLPDCADGYRADSMGRCIKFVKVDEAAHLNFLLNRLNEMYAAQSSEEEVDDSMPTAGPLQVNIPLGQAEEEDVKNGESIDMKALVNGQFDDKVNVKRQPDKDVVKESKPNIEQAELPPAIAATEVEEDYEYIDESTEESESTTQTEHTTTEIETTTASVTEETTGTTEIITSTLFNTADDGLKALFFRIPTNEHEKKNASKTDPSSNDTAAVNTTEKSEVTMIRDDIQADSQHVLEEVTPFAQEHHHEISSSNLRFPDEHFVKFPVVEEVNLHHRDEYPANVRPNFGGLVHHRPHNGELTQDQIQEIFKHFVQRQAVYSERPAIPNERIYNHRNRDKHEDFWRLAPAVREETPLLRRYPLPYYPSQGIYDPHKRQTTHHEVPFFGDETGHDYSQTFGRKRRRGNLR